MPDTKAIGVAYADPQFESVTVTGAVTAASVSVTGALNGTMLDGRSLNVNEARPRPERGGFGGGGGGGRRDRW